MSKKKPDAGDRTVDLFTGKTPEEEKSEAERIQQGLDNVEQPKVSDPKIESNVDRWRATAFEGREFVSSQFGMEEAGENQYRISMIKGIGYLEKTGNNDSGAYSYAGLFFPAEDIVTMAKVFVEAARAHIKGGKK